MFNNLFKAAAFHTANGADKAAIKGYGAGFAACHGVAKAAIKGMKACSEGQRRHQEALDKRHKAWEALQADLLEEKEEQACYATDQNGNRIEVTIE